MFDLFKKSWNLIRKGKRMLYLLSPKGFALFELHKTSLKSYFDIYYFYPLPLWMNLMYGSEVPQES